MHKRRGIQNFYVTLLPWILGACCHLPFSFPFHPLLLHLFYSILFPLSSAPFILFLSDPDSLIDRVTGVSQRIEPAGLFHTAARPLTIWHRGLPAWWKPGMWPFKRVSKIHENMHTEQKHVLHACTCAHTCMYSINPQLHTHIPLSDCGNSLFSFIAVFFVQWQTENEPSALDGKWRYNSSPSFSLFLSIYLSGYFSCSNSYSSFLPIFHHLFPSFSQIPAFLPTRAHTRHHPTSLWAVRERRRRGEELSLLGVGVLYFFKGLSGPLVCIADRLDLIPGLIQSLSQLRPAQPSPTRHGTAQMPLCILLVAKYTQGTVPKAVVHWTEEGLCVCMRRGEHQTCQLENIFTYCLWGVTICERFISIS